MFKPSLENHIKKLRQDGWTEIEDWTEATSFIVNALAYEFKTNFIIEQNVLRPRNDSGKYKITLSTKFGIGKFPYHTDGVFPNSPRFLILRYLAEEPSRSGTLVLDILRFASSSPEFKMAIEKIYTE